MARTLKERLINVGKVLIAPFTSTRVVANVQNKPLKASLEYAANNPFTTALIVATAVSSAGRAALAKTISTLSTKAKVVGGVGVLASGGLIAGNPKLVAPIISTASYVTPESIPKFTSSIGKITASKTVDEAITNVGSAAKQNPVLSAALLGITAYGITKVGAKVVPALQTYTTAQNTAAVKNSNNPVSTYVPLPKESSNDIKIAKIQAEQALDLAKQNINLEKIRLESALSVQHQQTQDQLKLMEAQAKLIQASTIVPVPAPIVATPILPTVKKKAKKKKKKAKKKPKKKAKKRKSLKKKKKKKKRKVKK